MSICCFGASSFLDLFGSRLIVLKICDVFLTQWTLSIQSSNRIFVCSLINITTLQEINLNNRTWRSMLIIIRLIIRSYQRTSRGIASRWLWSFILMPNNLMCVFIWLKSSSCIKSSHLSFITLESSKSYVFCGSLIVY